MLREVKAMHGTTLLARDGEIGKTVALFAILPTLDWYLSELGWDRFNPSGEYVWHWSESAEETSPPVASVVPGSGS